MQRLALCVVLLLFGACVRPSADLPQSPDGNNSDEESEMGQKQQRQIKGKLFVEPAAVTEEREDFQMKLRELGRSSQNKRPLYDKYIAVIGANGILDGIETLWPKCHSEAHALGSVIHERVGDIGTALRICADGCYSGCMHGVLMKALSAAQDPNDPEGHVNLALLKDMVSTLCFANEAMTTSYAPGDCAHGVGHALMFLANYDTPKALELCRAFDQPAMDYYCATGAYMEYMGEHEKEDAEDERKGLLYPCDTFDYPAACARYKMVHVLRRHQRARGNIAELVSVCEKLSGKFRLGCFHGLGNASMGKIRSRTISIAEVCLHGDAQERFVCIEGAMERMAKYHPDRAREICNGLTSSNRETCETAVAHGMYNVEKDLRLYLLE